MPPTPLPAFLKIETRSGPLTPKLRGSMEMTQPKASGSAATVIRESRLAPRIGSLLILFQVLYATIFVSVSSTWADADRSREIREKATKLSAETARTNNLRFLVEKVSTLSMNCRGGFWLPRWDDQSDFSSNCFAGFGLLSRMIRRTRQRRRLDMFEAHRFPDLFPLCEFLRRDVAFDR